MDKTEDGQKPVVLLQKPEAESRQSAAPKRKPSREKIASVNLQRLVSLRKENTVRAQPTIYNREHEAEKMNIFRFTESNIILHSKRKRKLRENIQDEVPVMLKKHKKKKKKKVLLNGMTTNEGTHPKVTMLSATSHNLLPSSGQNNNHKLSQNPQKKHNKKAPKKDLKKKSHNGTEKDNSNTARKKENGLKIKLLKSQSAIPVKKQSCKTVFKPIVIRTGPTSSKQSDTKEKPNNHKNGLVLLGGFSQSPGKTLISGAKKKSSNSTKILFPQKPDFCAQTEKIHHFKNSPRIEMHNSVSKFSLQPKYEEISVKHFEGYVHVTICPKKEQRCRFNPLDPDDDEIVTKDVSTRQETSPAVYNCFTPAMLDELITAFERAQNGSCKAVLLSSVGPMFSAGFDLRYFTYHACNCDKEKLSLAVELIRKFVDLLIHFTKPIIVAVQGPAIGLAASMLCLCDIVLADEVKTTFHFPYTQQGISPDCCSTHLLPALLKPPMANALLYGNRTLTPNEARDHGIVSEVLPHDSFMRHVIPRVRDVCSSALVSLSATKRLMRSSQLSQLVYANECENRALRKCLSSPDCLRTMHDYVTNNFS
uniref:Uncharacterized protein LOC100185155 n=1 Tax=Phallusia mammillata TaxID=59560 RepID=A0A6F9DIX5_9ASCI|nr:uncharacterized protein LOC100185155 [Phallusia mammillata]